MTKIRRRSAENKVNYLLHSIFYLLMPRQGCDLIPFTPLSGASKTRLSSTQK